MEMEDSRDKLLKICIKGMAARGLSDQWAKDRLRAEIKEIDNQAEHDYFLDLYDKKAKFNKNENNLLVAYLLGLTEDFDPSCDPKHVQGEFPDIDVDYLPVVQDYLRNEWCPATFGRDKVVNIGNYGTFGIKSALLDMARVHGADYQEIQSITKNLQDKDEDGNPLTWERTLELTPELASYCERNPEIADSARRLIDRNRSRGKHAGGTVVSNINISDLVPVMIDTDGNPVSGWTEGLHEQDLQPVGLIKFDVLAVKDLLRIAHCCNLIRQRHPEIKGISAVSGHSDWTDTSYLNDPKALELANRAETRGIFQFDGEGMRKLIKSGGVDRFEDLVAYSSLFRPGPLGMKMHERYVERKRGREEWESDIPECMKDILSKTYGILVYQEQVMKILNVVGDIPLIHCEKIRKAISKKKTSEFIKYKQMFLENGSKKTGWPIDSDDEKNMNFLWRQLENFSSYGFNKTLTEDTYILSDSGLKPIKDFRAGDKVFCIDESGERRETEVLDVHDHGVMNVHRVYFDDGHFVDCTLDHKFLTDDGQVPLWKIIKDDLFVLCSPFEGERHASSDRDQIRMRQDFQIGEESQGSRQKVQVVHQGKVEEETELNEKHIKVQSEALDQREPYGSQKAMREVSIHGLERLVLLLQTGPHERGVVHSAAQHAPISETRSLLRRRVLRAVPMGRRQCYDLEVACSTHNFILPNGVITSNSHAVAYTFTSARLLYLKAHYPLEFFCSTLGLEADEDKVKMYKREAERMGIKINRCDLNKSRVNYEIIENEIYIGFSNIKGIGQEVAEGIVRGQPYLSMDDFLNRFGTDKRIVEPLVNLGVFKDSTPNVLLEFYEDYKKWTKGNQDKEKRNLKRREELADSIRAMLKKNAPSNLTEHNVIMKVHEEGDASCMKPYISGEFDEQDLFGVIKKYAKSVLGFEHKASFSKSNSISLENWNPKGRYPAETWPNIFELERKHYGFSWEHPIQKSADYLGGLSFNRFKEDEEIVNAGVEVMIVKKPQEKISKNKHRYYFVLVEDEDWNVEVVTFWSEDYARFKEELEFWNEEQNRGNFMRMRVTRPGVGFKSYTFESPPKAIRHKVIPADKKQDVRLQIMQSPI